MSDAIRHLLRDEIKEERADEAKIVRLSDIKSIMTSLDLSAKQAMDALRIPVAEQTDYAALL